MGNRHSTPFTRCIRRNNNEIKVESVQSTADIEETQVTPQPQRGIVKEGVLYSAYKPHIKPFDLIFFKGNDFVSSLISYVEKNTLLQESTFGYEIKSDQFTHCGIVVTSDILKHPLVEKDKLYIWESTMSGTLAPDGVKNITGRSFYGSQLRDLDTLIDAYDRPDDTAIAVAHLLPTVFDPAYDLMDTEMSIIPSLRDRFTLIFNKYNALPYDTDPIVLGASAFGCLRRIRDTTSDEDDDLEVFCSELIARVYIELGFLPDTVNPKNVIPMDFFGFDSEGKKCERVPRIIERPKALVSVYHFFSSPLDMPQSIVTLDIDWFATCGNAQPQRNPISSKNMEKIFERWNWRPDIAEEHSSSDSQ